MCRCVCVCCVYKYACVYLCVCVGIPILPNTCQVKSAVWWAPRESCGPVHIHWLALHGGVGNIINQMRLRSVRVSASVCGVCARVHQCVVCMCMYVYDSFLSLLIHIGQVKSAVWWATWDHVVPQTYTYTTWLACMVV